ncbi:MAG TPA: cell filamentation protein Fic, partial [Prolixibacteraceae bacterium]|nr:cell filamentation protein Fic [Prolixibacteraceae bacterium]
MSEQQNILIYQNNDGTVKLDVHFQDESVWINRQQIAVLFNRDVKTIGKHINNIFAEGELEKSSTVANFAT